MLNRTIRQIVGLLLLAMLIPMVVRSFIGLVEAFLRLLTGFLSPNVTRGSESWVLGLLLILFLVGLGVNAARWFSHQAGRQGQYRQTQERRARHAPRVPAEDVPLYAAATAPERDEDPPINRRQA